MEHFEIIKICRRPNNGFVHFMHHFQFNARSPSYLSLNQIRAQVLVGVNLGEQIPLEYEIHEDLRSSINDRKRLVVHDK